MTTSKISASPTVAIIGFGVLGRATAASVQQKLSRRYDSSEIKFLIVETGAMNISESFYKRSSIHAHQIKHLTDDVVDLVALKPDIVFVCLPSHYVVPWIEANADLLTRSYVCIRSTMPMTPKRFLRKGRNSHMYSKLSYAPEYSSEQMLGKLSTESAYVWAASMPAFERARQFLYDFPSEYVMGDINTVAAHKLLTNAYLASLYAFNNAAHALYREYDITMPISLDEGLIADSVINGKHSALMVGGKCLPANLDQLDQNSTSDYWKKLDSLGTGDMSVLIKFMGRIIKQAEPVEVLSEPIAQLMIYGGNNNCAHEDSSFMYDSPASWCVQHLSGLVSTSLHQAAPERIKFEYISWCRSTGHVPLIVDAAPFAVFVQPLEDRFAQLKNHILSNIRLGILELTVFDPLCQFTPRQCISLRKFALEALETFNLQIVTQITEQEKVCSPFLTPQFPRVSPKK